MKREKETRKKTKNSAVGRLKRLVPRSKPDRMLVHAFVRELLDTKEEEMLLIVENSSYDKTDPGRRPREKNNTDEIVRAFSNVIDQIDSRVVDGFSCAILEFGTLEELLHDLANDARQIINPMFEFLKETRGFFATWRKQHLSPNGIRDAVMIALEVRIRANTFRISFRRCYLRTGSGAQSRRMEEEVRIKRKTQKRKTTTRSDKKKKKILSRGEKQSQENGFQEHP